MVIYIVEDDQNIRQMESYALRNSGWQTQEFSDGATFFVACEKAVPDLVILDLMLPGEDGMSILCRMRANILTKDIPVIIVSAKSTELDAVKGLDMGADDYITKPFGVMEFVSRVRAVLRRGGSATEDELVLKLGLITLDDVRRRVWCGDELCELTYKEHELLKYLLQNSGVVLTREKIMDRVWGTDFTGESRTVDMHIKTLRQKLAKGGSIIRTVRNVGYRAEL